MTQAIAEQAYQEGIKKILLLIPSQVLVQLIRTDFPFARSIMPISYPVHVMGGRTMSARRLLARSNRPGLYVLPYSCLSTKDASETLEKINPGLIICDEAHLLANRRAARTHRIFRFIEEREPQGVALSGTITSNTIQDYYHIIRWCLGENCPLPLQATLATEWGMKIDAKASCTEATGPIVPLLKWARRTFPEEDIRDDVTGFRRAYMLRLKTAPGVVSTGDMVIKNSLIVFNLPTKDSPSAELVELTEAVTEAWTTPNGDEIDHAIHKYKWLYELTAGFYNELTWPEPEVLAERVSIPTEAAEDVLEAARSYHTTLQQYHKEVRGWIETCGHAGCDSPMLVGQEISQHGSRKVGAALADLWVMLHEERAALVGLIRARRAFRGSDNELDKKIGASFRDSRVVRVDDYKIRHAVAWAKEHKRGIIWIYHKGIGEWAIEALLAAGVDAIYCPAGDEANETLDQSNLHKIKDKVVVASFRAHGVGKNLQVFDKQLFLQWPRSARDAEQTLGRLHRNKQKSDKVMAYTCVSNEFDEQCQAATLVDSLYIHQTTDNRQKLIYCTYAPDLPKMLPDAVLRERGFQTKRLDAIQRKALSDRFCMSEG